jgi:hypothetical protein
MPAPTPAAAIPPAVVAAATTEPPRLSDQTAPAPPAVPARPVAAPRLPSRALEDPSPFFRDQEEKWRRIRLFVGLPAGALVLMAATSLITLWASGFFERSATEPVGSGAQTPDASPKEVLAQQKLQTVLDAWKSGAPLAPFQQLTSEIWFGEVAFRAKLRDYHINAVKAKKDAYEIAVTLRLPAGPENRVYAVSFFQEQCLIKTVLSEDVNGTESHARKVLKAYLDVWRLEEDFGKFKEAHPEIGGVWDVKRAPFRNPGERLVSFEIVNGKLDEFGQGFRFTVALATEIDGKPMAREVDCQVFKNYQTKTQAENGLWTIQIK